LADDDRPDRSSISCSAVVNVDEESHITSPNSSPNVTEPPSSDAPAPAPARRAPPVKKPVTKKASTLVMPVARKKKKKNGNEKKYTPSEWAKRLQPAIFPSSPDEELEPAVKPSRKQPLKGTKIFYFGGEAPGYMGVATKNRLAFVSSSIFSWSIG
jgi:hypothetical protein